MKNILIYVALILLALEGLGYYLRAELLALVPAGMQAQMNARAVSNVTEVPLASDSQYASVQGVYPQFTYTSEAFNARIKDTILTAQAEHEKNATENWQAYFATDVEGLSMPDAEEVVVEQDVVQALPEAKERYQFAVDYSVTLNDDRYLSLVMHYGGYVGGAHGYQMVVTFTYDKRVQREVKITDLYTTLEQLQEAADGVRQKLRAQMGEPPEFSENEIDESWLAEGTDPTKPENFAAFTLAYVPEIQGDHITFYFQQYQVAAYSFGVPTVSILYGM